MNSSFVIANNMDYTTTATVYGNVIMMLTIVLSVIINWIKLSKSGQINQNKLNQNMKKAIINAITESMNMDSVDGCAVRGREYVLTMTLSRGDDSSDAESADLGYKSSSSSLETPFRNGVLQAEDVCSSSRGS